MLSGDSSHFEWLSSHFKTPLNNFTPLSSLNYETPSTVREFTNNFIEPSISASGENG